MNAMSKSLMIVSLLGLGAGAVFAQGLVNSEPVAAVDNIPPAPVTELQALDASTDEAASIILTWNLSANDAVSFTAFGNAIVPRGDVRGYRIYRQVEDGDEALIATVGTGVSTFVDEDVETGTVYAYTVRPFDLDNETDLDVVPGSEEDLARIVVVGGAADVVIVTTIKATMTFDTVLDLEDPEAVDAFVADFTAQIADLLGISPDRISITSVSAGSIVVEFEILDFEDNAGEPDAADALAQLIETVEEDTEALADLGTVLEVVDESSTDIVPVIDPLDAEGNLILGWFTREGNAVDFDDFFLFADHFGLKEGDENFDPRFDIVTNGSVDFNDFFRFADDFGKVVVNADEVRARLGL